LETILRLKVSAGKKHFRAVWNEKDEVLLVETKNKAQNGKANLEILKEMKRLLKTKVEIVSGFKSKEKLLKLNLSKQEALNAINTN